MILIVDDDNAVRMSVSLALRRAGYEPWAVGSEDEALAAVRDERVELAILDMNLTLSTTGRQGVEMLRKIRILRPEMPVIMFTAWGTIPQAVETMTYGAIARQVAEEPEEAPPEQTGTEQATAPEQAAPSALLAARRKRRG